MPGGTSSSIGPDHANHYKVGSAVMEPRGSIGGLTAKCDTVISEKHTGSHSSSDILHILSSQLSDSESCVALCRNCRSYVLMLASLLKQRQKQIIIREIFHCTG